MSKTLTDYVHVLVHRDYHYTNNYLCQLLTLEGLGVIFIVVTGIYQKVTVPALLQKSHQTWRGETGEEG